MIKLKKISIICIVLLLLNSCFDNNDLKQYIDEVKQRKTLEIEFPNLHTRFAPIECLYKRNRRNPFKPVEHKLKFFRNNPNTQRQKKALESYSLDSLKYVGSISRGDESWALIEMPNKEITYVTVGSYMGQNDGQIVLIQNDLLQLIETKKKFGTWQKRRTTMKLRIAH